MKIVSVLMLFLLIQIYSCQDLRKLFEKINKHTIKLNSVAAEIAWESSVNPHNPELPSRAARYQRQRIIWQQNVCNKLVGLNNEQLLNNTQRRQTYLLCRGPKFTFDEARKTSALYEELQHIYSDAELCIPNNEPLSKTNLKEAEAAILNYLSTVKQHLKSENKESTLLVANENLQENENNLCLKGENDFENMMKFSKNEEVLKFLWLIWREKIGPPMKQPYHDLVLIENRAAKRNGYPDIGSSWRDELEISNLRQLCRKLYDDIKPLYTLLHGVVRYFLRRQYGEVVEKRGPIPAHLLGNLWAQNWESLADLIIEQNINLDETIRNLNWTVPHMVKRAEDFYQSMGLPAMTDAFWRESVFARENNHDTRCHGTAADMFKRGDFRLLYCSGTSAEDFYVLHHEMGHIQYYMAYEHQPGIFRQANTAFHETIGDTIMLGVMIPQHLHRLGLINDSILYTTNPADDSDNLGLSLEGNDDLGLYGNNIIDHYYDDIKTNDDEEILDKYKLKTIPTLAPNIEKLEPDDNFEQKTANGQDNSKEFKATGNNGDKLNENKNPIINITTDDILMLKLALNKLPQIPFSLLIDEYRWKYFEGNIRQNSVNREFWDMALQLQGIAPPEERGEKYFDIGAKFHVPDNTPFSRYFLSSFLQHQLYESLCKAAVFGRRNVQEDLPSTITMNRCDIYGSKTAGKLLKDFMSRGHSQHWREILQATTGKDDISASALKRYYRPLYKLLTRLVYAYQIPIGW